MGTSNYKEIMTLVEQAMSKQDKQDDLVTEMFAGYGDLLTVQEVADITHFSKATIRNQIRAGKLPGRSIGRQYLVPKVELQNYFSVR